MWQGEARWCHVCESALERHIETKMKVHLKIKGQDAIRGTAGAEWREEKEKGGTGGEESERSEESREGKGKEKERRGKGKLEGKRKDGGCRM